MAKNSTLPHRRNFLLHLQERPEYDGPVPLKEPAHEQLTRAQLAQLHNEYVITRQVAPVPGVRPVYAKEGSESHPVLILEYIEGQGLSEIIQGQSLDLLQKLQLAVEIAGILGRIHKAGVMYMTQIAPSPRDSEQTRDRAPVPGTTNGGKKEQP